jgi:DNA-binding transcriptional LysR family regulator
MDLRQLRYFVQIIESGSLAKASRQLFIAQPALSQQLAKLEDEVGKPLLVRTPKGVTPTDNGAALAHHARFMLRQLEQALSIARQDPGTLQGMVSVGLAATTVGAVGVPLMRRVREKFPGIVLNVVEGMSGHLTHMMQMGQLDLSVLFSRDAIADLPAEPLVAEELFVILPAGSKLLPPRRSRLTVADAAEDKTKRAAEHAADVLAWDAIAEQLSPSGIPGDLLREALGPIQERLAQHAADTSWPQVRIHDDMRITAGERDYRLLSESERWRCDAMLAEAITHLSGCRLLVLDRMDVLDLRGRSDLLGWLDTLADLGEIDTALVFATLKAEPTQLPAHCAAHWINSGACAPQQLKEAA